MKMYFILIALLAVFMLLFPLASVGIANNQQNKNENTPTSIEQISESETKTTEKDDDDSTIKVLRVSSDKVIDLELYDYLIGAVSSEMSPVYEKEALKAQTVACYTYAKWLKANSDSGKLNGADISDSPSTHQGYLDEQELKDKWGDKYDEYIAKIKECVNEVMGEYLSYNNEPIMAVYHAISPGKTESASVVWEQDIPYLQSVIANGDKLSPDFDSTVTLTEEKFKEYAKKISGVSLDNKAESWVKSCKKSDNGFVTSITIGGKKLDGNTVRNAFSLKSPYFTLTYESGKFTFKVKGYGHGIGMSQYSADYMARQGSTYKEILLHFYKGAKLVKG
ncbi:MAG: stage II sporulation protein D [Faecalibacterium sp.]|nr:stage II sporulation protein D [Ruminococcus sp.]MCM1392025.1 stage II sporulation protein D [Ruminococcus sp.]MCM1484832.1 stage II sporulation protein D [Faecalibacterium sp.]